MSFKNGFREINGVAEIFQTSGRVNRGLEYEQSKLVVFELEKGEDFTSFNHSFEPASAYTRKMFERKQQITEDMIHDYFEEMMDKSSVSRKMEEIIKNENHHDFEQVAKDCRVIKEDKTLVLVDESILNKANKTIFDIINNSIQIRTEEIEKNMHPIIKSDLLEGVFVWKGKYDNFLGRLA